jgi:hypothetical protein
MQLENIIQEKVNELVASCAIEKMVETHISKTIDEILKDLFREYSDFGKKVKEAIGNKMDIDLSKLNIDSYTGMVCQIIEQQLNKTSFATAATAINEHVAKVLQQIEKKHWKLSEIVHKYIESQYGDDVRADLDIKEETYGNYIYLGERSSNSNSYLGSRQKNHDITLHMDKKDNKIFAVSSRGKHISPLTETLNAWEIFLMQLWVNGCTVEIDEDEAQAVADREID